MQRTTNKWSAAPKSGKAAIDLTPSEKAWLTAHPENTFGFVDSFEPLLIVNDDGTYSGVYFDILEALNKRLGTNIGLQIDSVPKILKKTQNKEVDAMLSLHPDYAVILGLLATDGYIHAYPTVFGRKEAHFVSPADFAGKSVAIINAAYFSEDIIRQYGGQANIAKVTNAAEGLQKVQNGSVDFFVGLSSNDFTLQKYRLAGLEAKHTFFDYTAKHGYAVRPDWPELVSILNKGISSFSDQEIETIVKKWMAIPKEEKSIELTAEERAWLTEHGPSVKVSLVNLPPLQFMQDDKFTGYQVDILEAVLNKAGLQPVYTLEPFTKVFADLKEKKTEISLDFIPTEERGKVVLFSKKKVRHIYGDLCSRRENRFKFN